MPLAPVSSVDCIVLGAGISGLVSTSVLLRDGASSVLVVDEYAHVGGNHIDASIGSFTFDIGSLVFQDDSPLLAHFPELLPRYTVIEPTWGRVNPQRRITDYPFSVQDDLLAAGPRELARIAASAVRARLSRRPLRSARDFADHWLGRRFVEHSGLHHYMQRFCGRPPEEIDLEFARSRMGWIAENASPARVLRQLVTKKNAPSAPNRQLARPASGFRDLYAPAVDRLERSGASFRLGEAVTRVERSDGRFVVHLSDGAHTADRLVSTIPLDTALKACGLATELPLPTVRLISLFCSFAGRRGFDRSVLFNFSGSGAWKRLTVYSDFYGRREGREYFTVEVIADAEITDVDGAIRDFRRHTSSLDLLAGDLRLEGSHVLDNAYPIYIGGSGARARRGVAALRNLGVESLGRQGAFQYQPTARVSALEAEAVLRTRPAAAGRDHDAPQD